MFKIRRARPSDGEAIARVHSAAVKGIRTDVYTPQEIQSWSAPKKPETYDSDIRNKEFFVVEENEDMLAFGVLNQQTGVIDAVYVIPEAGGRGIGGQVLRKLEERAFALGLNVLRLNASLNAVPFYEKAGYVGQERSKYRLANGVEIDCVPMVKTIGPR